jgi:hypothetical protein
LRLRSLKLRCLGLVVLWMAASASAVACSPSTADSDGGVSHGDASTDASDSGRADARESEVTPPGAPTLSALAVNSSSMPSLGLVPAFSSSVHDYYVRCAKGKNALSVSMTASPGAVSALVQPISSPPLPKQTVALEVQEDQAIVVNATYEKQSEPYWVRCLPHDFPELEMSPHPEAGAPTPGYYLMGNATVLPGANGYAMMLDGNGVPVWYRRHPSQGVFNVDNVVHGAISFVGVPVEAPYEIHHLDTSPETTTLVSGNGVAPNEHELRAPGGGNYFILAEHVEAADLAGRSVPLPDGGVETFGPNARVVSCDVQEVDSAGKVVWQWLGTDHFDPVKDAVYVVLTNVGQALVFDAFHCNSIDIDSKGNLLVSARNMDTVFYVERSSGKVLWKMGGSKFSTDGAVYIPVTDAFHRQHDARFQSSWKGSCAGGSAQLSLFDDELDEPAVARGVVYDVQIHELGPSDGGAAVDCGTESDASAVTGAAVAWEYKGKTNEEAAGSFRISPDGSRVIGWGTDGSLAFSEVDAKGNDLLDFSFPDGNWSYRAIKIPLTAFDLDVLRASAGQGD